MPELKDYVFGTGMLLSAMYSFEMLFQAEEAQTKYFVKGSTSNDCSILMTKWFGTAISQYVLIGAPGYCAAHKAGADSVKNVMGMAACAAWLWALVKLQKAVSDGEQKPDIKSTVVQTCSTLGLAACFLPALLKDLKK
eukprot:CAMPEP_0113820134 /NCGR_PEP_ID=MMETSP0328-20130328/1088_1 /TAXON_ID=39455 /ORGANISM="Alexandrium minutum" /LENGTH=137 /DNA_ID=CAMNT_0000788069 /DNA_START=119 /DNA_END=532 /DNA_ORIENTATION=+ /assembly_acc=CAM_ASM_000350